VQKSLRGNRRLSYAFRVAAIGQIRNERGNGWACLDQKVAEWTGNTIGRVRIDTARSVVLARRARAVVYALADRARGPGPRESTRVRSAAGRTLTTAGGAGDRGAG